jgi:Mg-chelatase subunit ChlD
MRARPSRTRRARDLRASAPVQMGDSFQPKRLDTPLDKLTRQSAGKRSVTLTARKRGRYVRARPMQGRPEDLAFDATLRSAAPFQRRRMSERAKRKVAFVVQRQDLQKKVRVRRAANLVLFVVDASWSMAAAERIEATKGAVLSLLHDAYQRRDQVGLIVFQREEARIVLPPTSSVELAQRALRDVPVGGKTPAFRWLACSLPGLHHGAAPQPGDHAPHHHPDGWRGQRLHDRDAAPGGSRAHGPDDS